MQCLNCNAVLTVHIAGSDGMTWYRRHYCENCRRPSVSGYRLECESCATRFDEFLETGLLGCSSCYDAFAPEMEPLLEKYRNQTPAAHGRQYAPTRIARARTVEAARALRDTPSESEPVSPEKPPANAVLPNFGAQATPPDLGDFASGVFLSFRLRAARNLRDIPYPDKLGQAGLEELSRHLLGNKAGPALVLGAGDGNGDDHDNYSDDGGRPPNRRVFPGQNLELYTGDEDQLRAHWTIALKAGMDLGREVRRMLLDLAELDLLYEWQFHPVHGFLTACPASSGSGLRASFMMNIAGLKQAGLWPAWRHELRRAGFEVRGSQGEGSMEDAGVQISNRSWPAGIDVPEALAEMLIILRRLESAEVEARGNSALETGK